MDLARLWAGAELRRRWRRELALAVLVAFIGAVVLTCVAAARRTDSSLDRYIETQAIPELETGIDTDPAAVPGIVSEIEGVPGVQAVGLWNGLYAAPDRDDLLPGRDFLLVAPLEDGFGREVARPVVLAGRMPDPNAVDEVVVNERAANTLGLELGEHTKLKSLSTEEGQYLQSGEFDKITFAGPTPRVHVVGIIRGQFDVQGVGFAPHYYLTSRAFAERYGEEIFGYGTQASVDTEPGADLGAVEAAMRNVLRGNAENLDVRDVASGFASVRDAARVQAIALLLVSLVALVAGAFATSQIIGRAVREQRADLETLRALGVTRAGWARLSAASQLPAALLAAALTVVAAWIASRWFPTGVPRRVEVDAGAEFDAAVLLLGGALIIAGMVGCAAAERVVIPALGVSAAARRPKTSRCTGHYRARPTDCRGRALGNWLTRGR